MINTIFNSWQRNYGLQLLLVGGVVGSLMCMLWYQQWLPELQFVPNQIVALQPSPAPPTYFVARILAPSHKLQSGSLLLFSPSAQNPTEVPLGSTGFEVDELGTATIVLDLQPGLYSAVAYIDENQNGQLDLGPAGQALEPFRTSSPSTKQVDWRDIKVSTFALERGSVHFSFMQFGD